MVTITWLPCIVFLVFTICKSVASVREQHLGCHNTDESIHLGVEITKGRVKRLFKGTYNDMPIVLSYPADDGMRGDFSHGLDMLLAFQESGFVTELVGYCKLKEKLQVVTKYYKHGSLDRLDEILQDFTFEEQMRHRLVIAMDYILILEYLHDSPRGTRVMCDSNDLPKTLSQYLITDAFRLIVNDLDALPEVVRGSYHNGTIKCGHRQLFGNFVAPEQLWPHENKQYNDDVMRGYDEKTDIWKLPDVLMFILGDSTRASQIKLHLFTIISQCKHVEASQRPSASAVRLEVKRAFDMFTPKEEL